MIFEGRTDLLTFTLHTIDYKIRSGWPDLKNEKGWIFFHLVTYS